MALVAKAVRASLVCGKHRREAQDGSDSDSEDCHISGQATKRAKTRRVRDLFGQPGDELLRRLFVKNGSDWIATASEMMLAGFNVDSKKCRDRYNNYAHPLLDHTPCRPEEVLLFIVLHQLLGNKWTPIAEEMSTVAAKNAAPGAKTRRSENWCKNQFNSKLRKKKKNLDEGSMWAPLYDYQATEAAAGRGAAPPAKRKHGAELAEEKQVTEAPVRRSTRVTERLDYSFAEVDDEEEEEESQAAIDEPVNDAPVMTCGFTELMFSTTPTTELLQVDPEERRLFMNSEVLFERCSSPGPAFLPIAGQFALNQDVDLSSAALEALSELGFYDFDPAVAQNDEPLLAPAATPAAAGPAASEEDFAQSLNETGAAAFCPSAAHSARSDGAAGSIAPCLTPSSRNCADPRDTIIVVRKPLQEFSELITAHEMKPRVTGGLNSVFTFLRTGRGLLDDDDVEAGDVAARARLDGVSAYVHKKWPSVQCMMLMLRSGALNKSELAGCVYVQATEVKEMTAALQYAESMLSDLLGC